MATFHVQTLDCSRFRTSWRRTILASSDFKHFKMKEEVTARQEGVVSAGASALSGDLKEKAERQIFFFPFTET